MKSCVNANNYNWNTTKAIFFEFIIIILIAEWNGNFRKKWTLGLILFFKNNFRPHETMILKGCHSIEWVHRWISIGSIEELLIKIKLRWIHPSIKLSTKHLLYIKGLRNAQYSAFYVKYPCSANYLKLSLFDRIGFTIIIIVILLTTVFRNFHFIYRW